MAKDKLRAIELREAKEWNEIVRSFKSYDTYWLAGYVKAFWLHGDGEPRLIYYKGADGTRGINVVMVRDIADDTNFEGLIEHGQYYDAATPYGYGGWLVEGDGLDGLFAAYERWCRRNSIITEFVRFHPILGNYQFSEGFYDVIKLGEVVHMDLASPETIWGNMSSRGRNMVRKAYKSNVKVYNGRYPNAYRQFKTIYDATMDIDCAKDWFYFSEEFYESLLNDLPFNAQVFWAEIDNKPIAAAVMLSCNGMLNYHLSGSLREFSSLGATNLILYEAALWGCENGCRTLYLGGGVGSGEDSLFRFKRSFYKGDLNRFRIGKRIIERDVYEELVSIREVAGETISDSNFFPEYRG